jgi:hypothetical protein
MNGESTRSYESNKTLGVYKRRVPGLRDEEPPPPCKVYKMIDGKKTLVRIE